MTPGARGMGPPFAGPPAGGAGVLLTLPTPSR